MRFLSLVAALAAVSACSPGIPDSGAGMGYDSYDQYQPEADTAATAPADTNEGGESEELAAATQAALTATQAGSGEQPQADFGSPPPETVTTATGISEENDFDAIDDVRTIESDAELIARNREQYKVIQPTALPARSGEAEPNIVDYALSNSHPVGTRIYTRIGINKTARYQRNCAKYASADQAQLDFLDRGGPNRDRFGLDPDGDGYACGWNPAPYRRAVNG